MLGSLLYDENIPETMLENNNRSQRNRSHNHPNCSRTETLRCSANRTTADNPCMDYRHYEQRTVKVQFNHGQCFYQAFGKKNRTLPAMNILILI